MKNGYLFKVRTNKMIVSIEVLHVQNAQNNNKLVAHVRHKSRLKRHARASVGDTTNMCISKSYSSLSERQFLIKHHKFL